jgi:hypothetical protein
VLVELERFGTGNQARLGDWCGIRLKLTDSATKQRELIVRLESTDADGDELWAQTSLTSNPGLGQQVWLYSRLPMSANGSSAAPFKVAVYEAVETRDRGEPGSAGYRAGTLLATTNLAPKGISLVPSTLGMIAVMGSRSLGLQQYSDRSGADTWHKWANEATEIVTGLTPEDLPDRWMGLSAFEAIVWADGDPAKLRGDRAKALRDYVMRGGHLLVVLPPVGQTWTNPASNELIDIMPPVVVTPHERVDFEPYRPLLTLWNSSTFPAVSTVQTFTIRAGALPSEASCILKAPGDAGECVVVRRDAGAGSVTLIGLDLNQTALSQYKMIDAEVFWHRVLGRRGTLITPESSSATPTGRRPLSYDSDISRLIAKSGRSATGVLAGFIVFALYWALAGPVGFAVLKRKGWAHHSWLYFIGASGVFTALAWGGAQALRPKNVEISHFTLLDHVFGQPFERARMWASVLLPHYGKSKIAVGEEADAVQTDAARHSLNSITSWDGLEQGLGGFGGFPDAQGYIVDARTPDVMTVPTRQTVKQVHVDWVGGPRWEMPTPLPADAGGIGPLKLNDPATPPPANADVQLGLVSGMLSHKLPGPLTDVLVVVVWQQTGLPNSGARAQQAPSRSPAICQSNAYRWVEPWNPGQTLSLDAVTRLRTDRGRIRLDAYLEGVVPSSGLDTIGSDGVSAFAGKPDPLLTLALFPMFPTPDHPSNVTATAPQRSFTHGFDLDRWFTRPCLIIIGKLGADKPAPSGVPIEVDGRPVAGSGVTIVRWVYPFPDHPPSFPAVAAAAESVDSTGNSAVKPGKDILDLPLKPKGAR